MEIRQLKTFTTIAQILSFTKAADILGYAQSSVTTQIQLLEEELRVKLFDRLGKNVYLTPAGEKLQIYAKQILKLAEEAKDVLSTVEGLKGTITIGSVESLCATRFPQIYKKFHERFPEVEVVVKLSGSCNLKELLRENAIDIGFFLDSKLEDSDLVAEIVLDEPMELLAAPCHPLAFRCSVHPNDLNGEALILTETGCSYRMLFEQILSSSRVIPRSVLESGSNQAIKQLTMSGMGITFLPRIAVEDELKHNELVALNWAGPDFHIMTQLVYHKDKWVSPAIKAFFDTVKEELS